MRWSTSASPGSDTGTCTTLTRAQIPSPYPCPTLSSRCTPVSIPTIPVAASPYGRLPDSSAPCQHPPTYTQPASPRAVPLASPPVSILPSTQHR
ncbi:hypothetical protein PHLGIDRAFT_324769 [Phlebiopsis gigantea 11061_1 CR5-6]|uniref:Uncharacterized protein n=1 Tax=Phlebiopsis gigantea (strain 11061_1 CR5-6) TaxID=745531 RepID=A0A0C3RZI1_PHLG1|nr:hypothetical protein PHLGIDRAFT_324769 [Phlebiopsis gigantea 11061_1 CR5-6]